MDNPVNFPVEVRANVCTFFMQLQKVVTPEVLTKVKEVVVPVAEQVMEECQSSPTEAKLYSACSLLVKSFKSPKPT